jgi:hypothetical protein
MSDSLGVALIHGLDQAAQDEAADEQLPSSDEDAGEPEEI